MNEETLKLMESAKKALEGNNISAFIAKDSKEAVEIAKSLLKSGETISFGGSQSIKESGVMDMLMSGDYNVLDRSKCKTREETEELYRKSFFADSYFCSSNAVTLNGELYNVDGNSNRVAAICYGPRSVVMIVGYNKIVKDLDEAVKRVKRIAAPYNTKRLDCQTYCLKTGECVGINGDMPTGCKSDGRVCCNYVVSARQRIKGRIKVILVGEKLGY